MSGVGGDRFAPNDALTREQMALILYRYAQHKSYDVQVDGEPLEGFRTWRRSPNGRWRPWNGR